MNRRLEEDMPVQDAPAVAERPDLEKKSAAFSLVTGVGVGAIAAAGISLVTAVLERKMPDASMVAKIAASAGAAVGMFDGFETLVRNHERQKVRPWVERLERNALEHSLSGSPPQR